jgi:hypothetical protein
MLPISKTNLEMLVEIYKVAEGMFEIVGKTDLSAVPGCCCRAHLQSMLMKIMRNDVTGEKAHRWLGYVQGVVALRKGVTLEELKDLNR